MKPWHGQYHQLSTDHNMTKKLVILDLRVKFQDELKM